MEANLFEREAHFESVDFPLKQKCNAMSEPRRDPEKDVGGFDCNICFDSAQDPVVTLCGHLYCWPCIYKWLNVQTSSLDADQQQQNCPVCKANISSSSLVPLYGGGTSSDSKSKNPHPDLVIPQRPNPSLSNTIITSSHPSRQLHENFFHSQPQSFQNRQYFPNLHGGYANLASSNPDGMPMTNFFNPMIGMFGEMVYARIFGGSNTSLFYPHQGSNPFFRSNNLRMRRQEMLIDKSLSRVSFFLFCCIILCLLLF
ncbi:hypothetical protein PTKIN_Ptkin14bG0126100 [Pterospermum kingtungense]